MKCLIGLSLLMISFFISNPLFCQAPTITTVSPDQLPARYEPDSSLQQTFPVTISGTNFDNSLTVTFGSFDLTSEIETNSITPTSFIVNVTNSLTNGSGATLPIVVTTNEGQSNSFNFFLVQFPVFVFNINPNSGTTETSVTITGANFTPNSTVRFDAREANDITVISATSIQVFPPRNNQSPPNTVSVTVLDGIFVSQPVSFTYETSRSPQLFSAQVRIHHGNLQAVLQGQNLKRIDTVHFGNKKVGEFRYRRKNNFDFVIVDLPCRVNPRTCVWVTDNKGKNSNMVRLQSSFSS